MDAANELLRRLATASAAEFAERLGVAQPNVVVEGNNVDIILSRPKSGGVATITIGEWLVDMVGTSNLPRLVRGWIAHEMAHLQCDREGIDPVDLRRSECRADEVALGLTDADTMIASIEATARLEEPSPDRPTAAERIARIRELAAP